jgi:hypothetical protein
MVTRRCLRRTKLLRPDSRLNQLYTYCLAVLAARHGITVHATVVMSTGQKAAFFEAVTELRAFRRAYREALDRWRCGIRDCLFPAGTWAMRTMHGACTAPN